jgi:RHS repeat-associated protein
VGYVHGLGIDQPLALFKGTQLVVPHATWRGVYDQGSCLPSPCPAGLQFPSGNGSASVWGPTGIDPDKADWYGSLIWDQQDATGYQYKRNRYYNPSAGRFTQEDPIGLAGGLNLYGFAGGDPVNYSDPFGLCCTNAEAKAVITDLARRRSAINTAVAGFIPATAAAAFGTLGVAAGAETIAGSSVVQEGRIIVQAARVLRSPGMRQLEEAARSGTSAAARIGGRTVTYDPAPFSGLTNFGGNTFHLGEEAFASRPELTQTVLQELFRLGNGVGTGASGATAASETQAAFSFAQRAFTFGSRLGIW